MIEKCPLDPSVPVYTWHELGSPAFNEDIFTHDQGSTSELSADSSGEVDVPNYSPAYKIVGWKAQQD